MNPLDCSGSAAGPRRKPPSAAPGSAAIPAVALGLAKALLAQGKAREAEPVLDGIKDGPGLAPSGRSCGRWPVT